MKVKIEIDHKYFPSDIVDRAINELTSDLSEWSEKYKLDNEKEVWIIEIEGR